MKRLLELTPSQLSAAERTLSSLDRDGTAILSGPIGVGKSTVGSHALNTWTQRDKDRTFYVVPCADVDSVDALVETIGRCIGFRLVGHTIEELVVRLNRHVSLGLLLEHLPPSIAKNLATLGLAKHHVFITTTHHLSGETIQIKPLPLAEAETLVVRLAGDASWKAGPTLRKLVEALDRLPGPLVLTASRSIIMSVDEALERLETTDHQASSFEKAATAVLSTLTADERTALSALAPFVGGFDLRTAEAVLSQIVEHPTTCLEALVRASLIENESGLFCVLNTIRVSLTHQDRLTPENYTCFVTQIEHATAPVLNRKNLLDAFDKSNGSSRSTIAARLCELLNDSGDFTLRQGILRVWNDPSDSVYAWHRGLSCFDANNLDDAAHWFQKAAHDHSSAPAMYLECLRMSGQANEALTQSVKFDSASSPARHYIAVKAACEIDAGAPEKAAELMTAFLRAPDDVRLDDRVRAYRRAAYVHYFLENREEQRRMIERAIAISAEFGDVHWNTITRIALADCDLTDKRFAKASSRYLEALEQLPSLGLTRLEGSVLGNLGGAKHRLGDLDAARRYYTQAIEIHRATANRLYERDILFAFGALEFECGHDDSATSLFDAALELASTSEALTDKAGLLLAISWVKAAGDVTRTVSSKQIVAMANQADAIFEKIGPRENGWRAVCQATRTIGGGRALTTRLRDQLDRFPIEREIVATLESESAIPPAASHLYIRIAQVLSARRRALPPSQIQTLEWNADTFEVRFDNVSANLRRRKALSLVLDFLVCQRIENPSMGFDVFEIFAVGWPGEDVHPDTACERVYWAIRELRKLGLTDAIITQESGYCISEQIRVKAG